MNWFDDLYDKASGVFDKYADYQSKKYEFEALKDMNFVGSASATEGTQTSTGATSIGNGIKAEYVAFGLLAVVALFVLKK